MFQEEYEKLTQGDKTLFSQAVNDLMFDCFVNRRVYDRKTRMFKINPDFVFIERHFSLINDYISIMDLALSNSEQDGVIFVISTSDKNHLRFDPTTTLTVFALRSFYESALERSPNESEVLMTSGQLKSLVNELGLSNVSKRLSPTTISASLRTLDSFNIITRCYNSYGDPSYSFFILPSIRFIMSAEKINALYKLVTEGPDEDEGSLSKSFMANGGAL